MEQLLEDGHALPEKSKSITKKIVKWLLWSFVAVLFIGLLNSEMPEHEYKVGDWDIGTLSKIYHKPGSRVVKVTFKFPYYIEGTNIESNNIITIQVSDLHFISGNHIDWLNNELKGRTCSVNILSAEKEYLMKANIFCSGFGNLADYIVANGMGY